MSSATNINIGEFNDALSRYPALIRSLTKSPKPGVKTLEELDAFRYVEAPQRFGAGGETMDLKDVQTLVDWKLRHGTFRPTLPKLVASNSAKAVQDVTTEAFSLYQKSPSETSAVIKKLAELKGIGPATASLLLAVHDPKNVVFFSDELYRWLLPDNDKPKYTPKEFDELFDAASALMKKLKVAAVNLEKVAYVLIKEAEPAPEPKKPKPEPSGRPRGRPTKPESEKKPKPSPSGNPRGRPRKPESEKVPKSSPKPRGRPAKAKVDADEDKPETPKVEEGTKRKRGRQSAVSSATDTPASKKSSAKKIKDQASDEEDTPSRWTKKTKLSGNGVD